MMKKTHLLLLVSILILLCGLFAACGKTEQVSLTMVTGDGTDNTVVQIEKGAPYTLTEPTREGYAFAGWYTAQDYSGTPVTSITPDADTTVYAKWNKLYQLTLDPNGGTLATTRVMLSAGDRISEKIAGLIPEKADCRFGTWLLDGEPLDADAVMGNEDITLVAKYQVKYTVEILTQNETLDGYTPAPELLVEYGYIGEAVVPSHTVTGFKAVTKSDSVTRLVLSENASENAFKLYFDRESCTLTFVSNYPDGSVNESKKQTLIYGVKTKFHPESFQKEGYYLEGWALSANGEMVYYSHVMDDSLFNATPAAVEDITATGNITLYAVWSKGYTDLFGGSDIMYVSKGEENTVYLCRGGCFFKGSLVKNKTIVFPDANADFPEAVLNSDGETFLYKNADRVGITATLYEMGAGKGLNELIKLVFDDENGVTYSEKESAEATTTVDSKGTYVFDEDGNFVTTFTSGPLDGKTLVIAVGTVRVGSERRTAFQVRNEEDINLGRILHFVVSDNTIVVHTDDDGKIIGDLTLNGFGIASYNAGSSVSQYYYTYDAETRIITLMSSQGSVAGVLRLMELNGELGYMIYNASMDVTYTLEDGSTLALDGIQTATYTQDGVSHSGFFTTETSAFGGTILTFTEGDVTYKFMITVKTQEVLVDPTDPDSGTTSTKVTVVERKPAAYAEYYYRDSEGTYYGPLFVFETADRATVTVYGYNQEKQYHKIAAGTMTWDATTGLYLLTVTETFTLPEDASPVFTEPVDFSKVKTCALMLDSTLTQYRIHFWFNYSDGVETVDKTQVLTGSNGGKLTLVAGFAIYQINGKTEIGTYRQNGSVLTATFTDRNLYFTPDTENGTYTVATATTETYYEVGKDGKVSQTSYLTIDPVSGTVSYCVVTVDGETQTVTTYPGTLTRTGRTSLTGFSIYAFETNEKAADFDAPLYAFELIERSILTGNYFFRYDASYAGQFVSTNTANGVLTLDGFGFAATYSDGEGREIMGMYQKNGDEVAISSDTTYYFHLSENTCALRGSEYGKVYLMIDNQVFDGLYAELDGLGNATIFRMVLSGEEYVREPVDETATYTVNGDRATIHYRVGAEEHEIVAKFGTMTSGSNTYNALHTIHDEVVYSYVNEDDWSVLRLNGDGTANKYLTDGSVETGTYSLVTESLLYYVNTSGSEAYIYVYDTERGTATPRTYTAVAYYTPELDSLLFSEYGFAIFNNSVRYYYTVDENENVTLYYLDESSSEKNRYGYVEEDFGELSETKVYGSKTYYKNDGFAISFVRAEATKDYYPVRVDADNTLPTLTLTFAPTGGETFSVSGYVMIGDESYECTVVREIVDEVSRMYFRIGSYYFYITINYQGDGVGSDIKSTYEVIGLSNIKTMPSYTYLYYLYYIYSMMGSNYASQFTNTYGTVALHTVYKEDGSVEKSYMNATFGKSTTLMESDGTLIETLEEVPVSSLGNNFYRAVFEGADGYTYTMILVARPVSVFSTYGYSIYALLREEAVPANDGFVVTVNRVIASDIGMSAGSYFSFELSKDGVEVPASNVMMNDGKLYYIVRETGEGAKTYYYLLTLVEKTSGSIEEGTEDTTEEQAKPLPLYDSATVTTIEATTAYAADGKSFVDILPDNKILLMSLATEKDGETVNTVVLIAECTYDAETGVYTLKTSDDKTYTVSVTDGVATITETTDTTTEEQA